MASFTRVDIIKEVGMPSKGLGAQITAQTAASNRSRDHINITHQCSIQFSAVSHNLIE